MVDTEQDRQECSKTDFESEGRGFDSLRAHHLCLEIPVEHLGVGGPPRQGLIHRVFGRPMPVLYLAGIPVGVRGERWDAMPMERGTQSDE